MTEPEVKSEEQDTPPKKYVSADELYRRSSQYRVWSYTEHELEELKMQTNEKGRLVALEKFQSARSALETEKPEVFAVHGAELTAEIAGLVSFDEEQKYLYYFSQQIIQICSHFNMPTQVKATAMAFFKRFYLVNSVMEHRPKNVLYTIVFLAAKLENYFVSIESFCTRLPKTKPSDILDLEFIVLLSLKFTLLVHHPYRPLYGFFLDFQLVLLHPEPVLRDLTIDKIGALYDNAKKWLNDDALLSEVSFLYTPPQIALAAMYDVDKKITENYLKRKFLKQSTLDSIKEERREERKKEERMKREELKRSQIKQEDDGLVKESPEIQVKLEEEELRKANEDLEMSDVVKSQENSDVKQEENINVKQEDVDTPKAVDPEREQYETLVKTIKKCIVVAKTKLETSREESIKIDEKCFFALNPGKLLKKRIKALST
ncbi:CIC11C00000000582 [Sungouiella intermedia]|uniref:CIC11C00000000582 n=1 Tax=Sungouiella intermedia TaxID=45354 RepID=A0A1L0GDE9_9ASCO|nr:CIC11C00000000582 [[Candida] intermedia]